VGVVVWYDICLHCRATAADITAERGAWWGLWYDICLHCRATAADIMAERGAWQGLWYDICLHCRATAADMTTERGAWWGCGMTSLASSDVVMIIASAHIQMPRASMDKRRSYLIRNSIRC